MKIKERREGTHMGFRLVTEENEMAAGCRLWDVQVHLERLDGD